MTEKAKHLGEQNIASECGLFRKREYFAGLAMQGIITAISRIDEIGIIANSPKDISELSVLYADTLLEELAKTNPK